VPGVLPAHNSADVGFRGVGCDDTCVDTRYVEGVRHGVLVMLAVACHQDPPGPCGPGTCAGCCDSSGACVTDNGSNVTCGINGDACADCFASGAICGPTKACVGLDGGCPVCGPGTCEPCTGGCCVQNQCSTCTGDGPGVGAGCTSRFDCTGIDQLLIDSAGRPGGPPICRTSESPSGTLYPGGFCTRQCDDDAQCGAGNVCGTYGGRWGETTSLCYPGCDVDADCHRSSGYRCFVVDPTRSPGGVCVPAAASPLDAGPSPGPGVPGSSCQADFDCRTSGGALGHCIRATLSDGGSSGFTRGYCVFDCTAAASDAWCSGDGGASRCLPIVTVDSHHAPSVSWQCVAACGSSCRAGYVCADAGVCQPDCSLPNDCNGCLTATGCMPLTCDVTHTCR
jgi:hypothetical protein